MGLLSKPLAVFTASLPLLLQTVSAQSSGSFTFLTYNVAGLPPIFNDNDVPGDKGTNANIIGSKLAEANQDIVHLQEDFNFHAYIYETDNHPFRTPTTGGVPFGSGLNTVANFDWADSFEQIKWDKCNLNSGDCLTPKGFSYMRTEIAPGVEVDLYNLHADAGSDEGDANARRAGIEQILAYAEENSAGRAVIVGGDFNDRWTNGARSIDLLVDAGFTDPWVDLIKGGEYPAAGSPADACDVPAASNECEVVDKVLYRSGDSLSLTADSWSYQSDFFVQPDGNILSDHNPILVEFSWSA